MHSEYHWITRNSHKNSPNVLRQTYHPVFLLFIQYTICLHGFGRYLLHGFWWIRWLSIYINGAFTWAERFWWDLFQPAYYGAFIQCINAFSLISGCYHFVVLLIDSKGKQACHWESKQGSNTNTLTLMSNYIASATQSVSAGKQTEKPKSTHNPEFFTRLLTARIDITRKLKKNWPCSNVACLFDSEVNS